MYTSTMELGLNDLGNITGSCLDTRQQYSLTRCIGLAQLSGYSLSEFMQEFIEEKHPELRDYIIRYWYIA